MTGQSRLNASPLIFTHYGNTDYLARTLEIARLSNPNRRLILIGDEDNRDTARRLGWEHFHLDDYTSELRTEFLSCFREIKGEEHVSPRGRRNWVRFVLERWFIVAAFIQTEGITSFWHFDSDVAVVTDLEPFETALLLQGFNYTKQCSGACLNGFVTAPVAEAFCRYAITFFNDEARLVGYENHFKSHPDYALTEMEVFSYFEKQQTTYKGCHLERHFPNWWFDDVLCQADGCRTVRMGLFGPVIKDVQFDGRYFLLEYKGQRLNLAALNCSWLPIGVFDWILARVRTAVSDRPFASPKNLGSLWPGLRHEYRGLRAQLKQLLR